MGEHLRHASGDRTPLLEADVEPWPPDGRTPYDPIEETR